MNLNCESLDVLQGVQYLYWIGLICSTLSVLFIPVVQNWHRYGKLRTQSADWVDDLTVPKRWFLWFYLIGVLWTLVLVFYFPLVLTFIDKVLCKETHKEETITTLVGLPFPIYLIHLLRRFYEEWTAPPSSARMHVFGFVVGASFYIFAPLALVMACQVPTLAERSFYNLPWSIVGLLLFERASTHQYVCHAILRQNRLTRRSGGNSYYSFPQGDWFHYSSNPHYFAEMLIYLSFFFFFPWEGRWRFWGLVLAFTVLGLCVTGSKTHDWYVHRFHTKYAGVENRARVIPFVF